MTLAGDVPPPPTPTAPSGDDEQVELWKNVSSALHALPTLFKSELSITGVLATDLQNFNTSLAATIEQQVVDRLNEIREVWDPGKKYLIYRFERQPQRFPDVILRTTAEGLSSTPLMGIELKGWYALAKEREPSFRYKVTPAVCSDYDLLAVFPWALEEVISGSPVLFRPYVVPARYAAEYKNWYWQYGRKTSADTSIVMSTVAHHYPLKSDQISDRPVSDGGDNFGRYSRTKAMDDYITELFREQLSGIALDAWQRFFRLFAEGHTESEVSAGIDRLAATLARTHGTNVPDERDRIEQLF